VSSLTERDLEEVYVIRRAIEEAAVRLTIERADAAGLAELFEAVAAAEAAYRGEDLAAAWEADMAFHRAYCRLAGHTPVGGIQGHRGNDGDRRVHGGAARWAGHAHGLALVLETPQTGFAQGARRQFTGGFRCGLARSVAPRTPGAMRHHGGE